MELERTRWLERSAVETTYAPKTFSWAQLEGGPFEVRYGIISAPPVELSLRKFNLALTAEADLLPQKFIVALLADERSEARWFGSKMHKNAIVASRTHINLSTTGPAAVYRISVCEPVLERLFPHSPDVLALMENIDRVTLTQNRMLATILRSWLHRLFSTTVNDRTKAVPPALRPKNIHGTIIPLLASALESFHEHSVEQSKCLTRRLAAVRRCEEYMREHVDATLTLLDLSEVAGMRSRSLINAFEAVTGFSPMDYLKRLRLNGVHQTLQREKRSRTRIIDVATDWGFWHMGHFTNDYRAMFGETPSQTLLAS